MDVVRVERHIIKQSNEYYNMLDDYCFKSKNLYNFANYNIRKEFFKSNNYIRYNDMDKLLKTNGMDFDYRNMPTAQSSQQCLRILDKNWKSFFKSIKDWSKNKNKYNGRPKIPKYIPKDGRNILVLTNMDCKIKDGFIKFPKAFNGFKLKTNVDNLQQVRILPRNNHMVVEIVYKKHIKKMNCDNNKYVSIDIGIDNFATVTNNVNKVPIIISGRKIKSVNKFYNKQISHYKEIARRINGIDFTNRMNRITTKRNNIMNDLIHKASRKVVNYALSCEANTIIIGNNKNWKQNSSMGKITNQSFVEIPHSKFISQIIYKAEECGINVIVTEEPYTSGTSFLDEEMPIKINYNKSRRVKRGLFISNKGIKINSDVNGSLQIMKKVFPNAFSHGIEGYGFNPIRVNL